MKEQKCLLFKLSKMINLDSLSKFNLSRGNVWDGTEGELATK